MRISVPSFSYALVFSADAGCPGSLDIDCDQSVQTAALLFERTAVFKTRDALINQSKVLASVSIFENL